MELAVADNMETETVEKKKRKRLKHLCAKIREQMEFYFSDANLHKDRFLKKLISENAEGYVDLNIFSKFNKINSMTTDMNVVAKALSSSKHLQVSEDQKLVKRSTPILAPKDIDSRTVYVECLPLTSDHEWLKKTFSECGKVLYVSLPKYKSTGDIKGFAFIEFESVEGAEKACELLNNPPAGADKPGKFPKASKQQYHLQRQAQKATAHSNLPVGIGEGKIDQIGRRKRRRSNSDNTADSSGSPRKVRKRSSASECSTGSCHSGIAENDTEKTVADISPVEDEKTVADISPVEDENSQPRKRKLNAADTDTSDIVPAKILKVTENSTEESKEHEPKHVTLDADCLSSPTKRKLDKHAQKKVRISDQHEVREVEAKKKKRVKNKKKKKEQRRDLPELRVLSKKEWLSLREEYLNLQKTSVNKLKSALNEYKHSNIPAKRPVTPADKAKPEPTKEKNDLQFTPDVIVKIISDKPMHRKEVKMQMALVTEVAYADIQDDAVTGYMRCPNVASALTLSKAELEGFQLALLKGDEENEYWQKIQSDRDKKINTKSKTKRRGREKVVQRVDNTVKEVKKHHVVFDD